MATRLRTVSPCLLLLLLFGPILSAQDASQATGFRLETFANPTSEGREELDAIVWYPRVERSLRMATVPESGFPVLVFLHGHGGPAAVYYKLGQRFAAQGYIVVLSDTSLRDSVGQVADGRALFHALKSANQDPDSRWHGVLDMERVGLAGHSMGGGSTAHVLADNPGYAAGFCFAPWEGKTPFDATAEAISVPVGIIHGQGDETLAWETTGKALYDALPRDIEKFLYLVDEEMDHQNLVVHHPFANQTDRAVFENSMALASAFFRQCLSGDSGLEPWLKSETDDPRRVRVYRPEQRTP